MRERYGVVEERHVLLESLHAAGFEHEDVDVVVLSHLHFDHAGGLLAPWAEGRAPELLFPNATYVVSERMLGARERTRIRATAPVFIPELPVLLEKSGRLELVEGAHSQALGNERALPLQRRAHAGADAGGDRRARCEQWRIARRRGVLRRPDPGPAVGARADHDGLRPQRRIADRREARIPGRQARAQRASVLHPRSRMRAGAGGARRRRAASAPRTKWRNCTRGRWPHEVRTARHRSRC